VLDLYEPIPGYWYINRTGKLMKVKMVGYDGNRAANVLIQFQEGNTRLIDINDWRCLDLIVPRRDQGEEVTENEQSLI
jgi:hypothetical protein